MADLMNLTADIITRYVESNSVQAAELPALIRSTYDALATLGEPLVTAEPEIFGAVSVRRSLSNPDLIISMIDGKGYKTLKRHLTSHGLTMDDYRALYKLPADYPSVAASYSAVRRDLAKKIGLGRKAGTKMPPKAGAKTGRSTLKKAK